MFGNWNRCIELVLGGWILILHDDDMIEDDYIETMIKIEDEYPDAAVIGCDNYEIDSESKKVFDNKELRMNMSIRSYHMAEDLFDRSKTYMSIMKVLWDQCDFREAHNGKYSYCKL